MNQPNQWCCEYIFKVLITYQYEYGAKEPAYSQSLSQQIPGREIERERERDRVNGFSNGSIRLISRF